ncbi:MAG: DUF4384 domain-containing protein [Cyanobacteria bacterium SZAS LIN-2]|nr:DUF4384 domain-containing protein [Cyanobacteria bacterium SZAS LIN-2]
MARNLKSFGLRTSALSIAALAFTSLSFTSLVGSGPAQAADGDQGPVTGAKGLFFEQLEKPKENLNTGLRYWIEMRRNGTTQRVSNKTQFRAGDSIRFHVRSNINGYAYILLSSGSQGEQSVLFPNDKTGEPNRLEGGREYVLPQDGGLTFDENPGTEKLTLLLSRTPIDAKSYLAKPAAEKEITLIASAQTGSKDLVPARIYVAMGAPRSDGPPPILVASSQRPAAGPAERASSSDKSDKDKADKKNKKKIEKKVAKKDEPKKVASSSGASSSATVSSGSSSSSSGSHRAMSVPPVRNNDDENTTTIVSQKSNGVLHVDVDLDHI